MAQEQAQGGTQPQPGMVGGGQPQGSAASAPQAIGAPAATAGTQADGQAQAAAMMGGQ